MGGPATVGPDGESTDKCLCVRLRSLLAGFLRRCRVNYGERGAA